MRFSLFIYNFGVFRFVHARYNICFSNWRLIFDTEFIYKYLKFILIHKFGPKPLVITVSNYTKITIQISWKLKISVSIFLKSVYVALMTNVRLIDSIREFYIVIYYSNFIINFVLLYVKTIKLINNSSIFWSLT